jgi:hypothetical protein
MHGPMLLNLYTLLILVKNKFSSILICFEREAKATRLAITKAMKLGFKCVIFDARRSSH